MILETDALNAPVASYVLGGAQILSQTKNGITSTLLPDAQGSTRLLTNASGAVIAAQAFEYSAFGDLLSASTPDTRYLYTGQQYDSATDLYSLRARYYDAGVGRFMSRDTWAYDFESPVELNRYVYVANNPTNWDDPSGHSMFETGVRFVQSHRDSRVIGIAARTLSGASIGGALGGLSATALYYFALCGACGSELQQWAMETSFVDFQRASIATGIVWGAFLGGVAGFGSFGKILSGSMISALGISGMHEAAQDMWGDGNPFTPDNRMDICNTTYLVLSAASVVGGVNTVKQGYGIYKQQRAIKAKIWEKLNSQIAGDVLEGRIANLLQKHGYRIVNFDKKYGPNGSIGQVDIETQYVIIEVTTSASGKLQQITKLMHNPIINPNGKAVLLYAPNYGGTAGEAILSSGAALVRNEETLLSVLQSLGR